VGVQERVTGAAGAMVERRRDDPAGGHETAPRAAAPLPHEHRVGFVVADDLVDRLPMGVADRRAPIGFRRAPTTRSHSSAVVASGHSPGGAFVTRRLVANRSSSSREIVHESRPSVLSPSVFLGQ
jgi:hypothetical protein